MASSPQPTRSAAAPFLLHLGAPSSAAHPVIRFRGSQRISRVYAFDLWVAPATAEHERSAAASDWLEQDAVLSMEAAGDSPRRIHGVITRVEQSGVDAHGNAVFRVRLAPRLALLAEGQNSRVFQEQPLSEILAAVLSAHGVAHRFAFVTAHAARTYCVQHRESDLAFVARLCAEDGVFFWFEPPEEPSLDTAPASGDVVVFGDSPSVYPALAGSPPLAFRGAQGATALGDAEHHVMRFSRRRATAPRGARIRGYDVVRPATHPGATAGEDDRRRSVYDHHDHDERLDITPLRAATRLEQARAGADLAEGTARCRRLAPGHRFTLADHDIDALNGEYVVTRVDHEGHTPELSGSEAPVYEARFRCAPADVAVRPRRPRTSIRQVLETATVVGPPGQEIHTDAHGRIKVQFHWDLDGKNDEQSSCWLRVAQAWAGQSWGSQFIPRIGTEVLVGFLGGDLDRPAVVGALYNGAHPPPFPLPEQKTRSGLRTRSTPGGGGYNELSFEDRAGAEQIALRAERDLTASIGHDHAETVGHDKRVNIGGQHVVRVQGDRDERIAGALSQSVDGGASVRVGGDARSTTTGNVAEEILQSRSAVVHGSDTTTVLGASTTVVEGPHVLRVDAEHTVLVGEGRDDGQAEIAVSRKYLVSSGGTVRLRAEESIVLSSGDSTIEISPNGVVVRARSIALVGSESASMSGPGPAMRLGDEAEIVARVVRITSADARIELDEEASVQGKRVLLNCDGRRPRDPGDGGEAPETQPFRLKLTDEDYAPYAGKRYTMICEGEKFAGTTGPDGLIAHDVPKGAKTAQITVWTGAYPTSAVKRYAVQIEALADAGSIGGAQVRLKNLGYYRGAGKGEIDGETREALRAFQRDHALAQTGELDDETRASLVERHGS